jgi:hypothetical protein
MHPLLLESNIKSNCCAFLVKQLESGVFISAQRLSPPTLKTAAEGEPRKCARPRENVGRMTGEKVRGSVVLFFFTWV